MDLDANVPIPGATAAVPAKPARRRASPKPKAEPVAEVANPAAGLLRALKFISIAQKKAGTPVQQFCNLSYHWAAATNETLTVATRIEEDLTACPHTLSLIDALSKCSGDLAITQLSPQTLAVDSGLFKGLVNCASFDEIQIPAPDPICAAANDRIKFALGAVACLATDGAPTARNASVLLQSGSAVATNGHALLEAWHGVDLPPNLLIPKVSAVAIAKCDKTLTGFGFSPSSATFWFEDGSFIKTQLYNEQYPNYHSVIDVAGLSPAPLPSVFFKGVKAIESFSEDSIVYFHEGILKSNKRMENASTYKIEGLPQGFAFNAKYLIMLESAMKTVAFQDAANGPKAYFFGENIRGVLMGVAMNEKERREYEHGPEEQRQRPTGDFSDMDDDIPF